MPLRSKKLANIQKIAVLRANAIGDYVFTIPALEALRKAYPQAEITLLGMQWHADFLAGRPGPVDRVIVVPDEIGLSRDPAGPAERRRLDKFFDRMANEHFDLALQMYGGGRFSNPFVRRLGARITAGLKAPEAEPLDLWIPYVYFQNEVLRLLEIAALVGARPVQLEPRILLKDSDLAEARSCLSILEPPVVAFHTGAGDPRRRWPVEKLAAVADSLHAGGAQIVLVGSDQDTSRVSAMHAAMQGEAFDMSGKLSLGGLAGLLSLCSLVISNDSGPLHLARAVGAATVGIYWCGNLINAGPVTSARNFPVISWRLECPICGTNTIERHCEHTASFVADIPVEEVLAAAQRLLKLIA